MDYTEERARHDGAPEEVKCVTIPTLFRRQRWHYPEICLSRAKIGNETDDETDWGSAIRTIWLNNVTPRICYVRSTILCKLGTQDSLFEFYTRRHPLSPPAAARWSVPKDDPSTPVDIFRRFCYLRCDLEMVLPSLPTQVIALPDSTTFSPERRVFCCYTGDSRESLPRAQFH